MKLINKILSAIERLRYRAKVNKMIEPAPDGLMVIDKDTNRVMIKADGYFGEIRLMDDQEDLRGLILPVLTKCQMKLLEGKCCNEQIDPLNWEHNNEIDK